MQNMKFLARLFLKLQENGPLLSARPRINKPFDEGEEKNHENFKRYFTKLRVRIAWLANIEYIAS